MLVFAKDRWFAVALIVEYLFSFKLWGLTGEHMF